MNFKSLLFSAMAIIIAFAAQAQTQLLTFKSGNLYYEVVDETNKLAFVAPNPNGSYSGIGSNDFATEVTYQGVTYKVLGIGAGALYKAEVAGNLILPEGYMYIDNGAFEGADIVMLKFPTTMQYVSETAFMGNNINSFSVTIGNPYFKAAMIKVTGKPTLFVLSDPTQTKILAAPGQGVMNFGGNVSIPEGFTEIALAAFAEMPNLTGITLPKGMTKVGKNAFQHCEKLTSVTINEPTTVYGNGVFIACPAINRVSLPNGMPEIANHMFDGAEALTSVKLPDGLKRIGCGAFVSCGLTSVNLPETVELVDSSAFQWITTLSSIDLKNVKHINNQAFGNMSALTSVTGGDHVEYIGNAAFIRCNALSTMPEFPNVKTFDGGVFYNCTGLNDVTIPASLEVATSNPFVNCTSLNEIKVEDGSTHFAELDECLYEMRNNKPYRLVSMPTARANTVMTLQPGTEVVGEQAMRYAPVTEFIAQDGLKTIESGAFMSAANLTNIELPSTIEAIEGGFSDNTAIQTITVLATVPPAIQIEFTEEVYANATLYVPSGSVDAYKTADVWKNFQNIEGVGAPALKGDLNGDGTVDVADLNIMINVVLGSDSVDSSVGDLNGDTIIDIADVNALINMILG